MAASVWKRLQRVNKKAAKFQYTASYHRIDFEITTKWKPNKLSIAWTRRSRRVVTESLEWEPSLKDPLKGTVIWPVPENHVVAVTLFKDSRTNELEDKDWIFVLEDISSHGKRRRLAFANINMCRYASLEPTQKTMTVQFIPNTAKIVSATLTLTISCVLLREGRATDEDMQSLASLFSVNNNSDIAQLDDLDDEDFTFSDHSTKQVLDLTQQMELMTSSLTGQDLLATPISVQSLNFDNSSNENSKTPTPLAVTPIRYEEKDREDKKDKEDRKERTEFLRDLTRLSMRSEQYKDKKVRKDTSVEFPSLNNSQNDIDSKSDSNVLKNVVFKPKHLSKYNLKPLQLKGNLNSMENGEKSVKSENTSEKSEEFSNNLVGNGEKESDRDSDQDKTPIATEINSNLLAHKIESRDKTPVQELLEWCSEVTRDYKQCRVTNLTTSWRDGLAFCAVIHHFRPDLIDYSSLSRDEPEQNLRTAFEASSKLGISQVLTAADINNKPIPDKLAIMTHLFQLRAHFTGGELRVEQLGGSNKESSYMVGRHDTDTSIPKDLFSLEIATARGRRKMNLTQGEGKRSSVSSQESVDSQNSQERVSSPVNHKDRSPTSVKDVKGLFLDKSKSILGKMLSPSKDKLERRDSGGKWFEQFGSSKVNSEVAPVKPAVLMTRTQLIDPFASDEEDDSCQTGSVNKIDNKAANSIDEDSNSLTPNDAQTDSSQMNKQTNSAHKDNNITTENLPKPTPQLLSRHDELKEKARQLLEATKREAKEKKQKENEDRVRNGELKNGEVSPCKLSEEKRQAELRERARKLIAGARAGVISPTSPTRIPNSQSQSTIVISRQSMLDELAADAFDNLEDMLPRRDSNHSSRSSSQNSDVSNGTGTPQSSQHADALSGVATSSPIHSFSDLVKDGIEDDDQISQDENDNTTYIQSEMAALEREQAIIDEEAAILEKELRNVMESSNSNEEEDKLMAKWFTLVNKKNALLRRQMQLNILEQEQDLTQKCALLEKELRQSLAVEEWKKSLEQRRRERLLLNELVEAVNTRNRLVHEMDEQERAIEADDEIERDLSNVEIQRKEKCILQ